MGKPYLRVPMIYRLVPIEECVRGYVRRRTFDKLSRGPTVQLWDGAGCESADTSAPMSTVGPQFEGGPGTAKGTPYVFLDFPNTSFGLILPGL